MRPNYIAGPVPQPNAAHASQALLSSGISPDRSCPERPKAVRTAPLCQGRGKGQRSALAPRRHWAVIPAEPKADVATIHKQQVAYGTWRSLNPRTGFETQA